MPSPKTVEEVRDAYAAGELTEAELEAHLETAIQTPDPEPDDTTRGRPSWRESLETFKLAGGAAAIVLLWPIVGLYVWPKLYHAGWGFDNYWAGWLTGYGGGWVVCGGAWLAVQMLAMLVWGVLVILFAVAGAVV